MGIGKNIFPNRRLQASTWCVDLHDDTDAAVFGVLDERLAHQDGQLDGGDGGGRRSAPEYTFRLFPGGL